MLCIGSSDGFRSVCRKFESNFIAIGVKNVENTLKNLY